MSPEETSRSMDDAIDETEDQARRAARSIRNRFAEGADTVADAARPSLKDELADTLDTAKEELGHLREAATEALATGEERVREYVRERPFTSMAIAAGVTLLLERMFCSSRPRY